AVRHLVALALAAAVGGDQHLARAGDDDLLALAVRDVAHRAGETHRAVRPGLDRTGHRRARRRAADAAGPHRELRARLADGLRRDHGDRLARIHQRAAAEVAAVALGAKAVAGLAGQRGAHAHLVDAQRLDLLDRVLVEQGARLESGFLRLGIDDIRGGHAAENPVAQRLDDLAAL